jgi:uncharacterized protein (TIGR00369 family)
MVSNSQDKSVSPSDQCFGCGKNNPCGVKLEFDWDGKVARAEFIPTELHQGWGDIVHGGILATLLDEAMAYAACFEGVPGVTGAMELKYKKPTRVWQKLIITARVTKNARRFAETEATITQPNGTIITEAKATQFIQKLEL